MLVNKKKRVKFFFIYITQVSHYILFCRYNNNINSLLNMLELSKRFKINKFIFSSSCSLYGDLEKLPANEESPISDPKSPYAYTKLVCERILQDFSKSYNQKLKIVLDKLIDKHIAHGK